MKQPFLSYEQKSPCKDCPFRKDAPFHRGVIKDLPQYHSMIERGQFAHTCHQSDPRSDGYVKSKSKKVNHCAGALILMEKIERTEGYKNGPTLDAKDLGLYDPKDLKGFNKVFDDFTLMIRYYQKLINQKISEKKPRRLRHE